MATGPCTDSYMSPNSAGCTDNEPSCSKGKGGIFLRQWIYFSTSTTWDKKKKQDTIKIRCLIPVILTSGRLNRRTVTSSGQPGLHTTSQASLGYRVIICLKTWRTTTKPQTDTVMHACNLRIQETEAGGLPQVWGQPTACRIRAQPGLVSDCPKQSPKPNKTRNTT